MFLLPYRTAVGMHGNRKLYETVRDKSADILLASDGRHLPIRSGRRGIPMPWHPKFQRYVRRTRRLHCQLCAPRGGVVLAIVVAAVFLSLGVAPLSRAAGPPSVAGAAAQRDSAVSAGDDVGRCVRSHLVAAELERNRDASSFRAVWQIRDLESGEEERASASLVRAAILPDNVERGRVEVEIFRDKESFFRQFKTLSGRPEMLGFGQGSELASWDGESWCFYWPNTGVAEIRPLAEARLADGCLAILDGLQFSSFASVRPLVELFDKVPIRKVSTQSESVRVEFGRPDSGATVTVAYDSARPEQLRRIELAVRRRGDAMPLQFESLTFEDWRESEDATIPWRAIGVSWVRSQFDHSLIAGGKREYIRIDYEKDGRHKRIELPPGTSVVDYRIGGAYRLSESEIDLAGVRLSLSTPISDWASLPKDPPRLLLDGAQLGGGVGGTPIAPSPLPDSKTILIGLHNIEFPEREFTGDRIDLPFSVALKNPEDRTLVVKAVRSSCGCTKAAATPSQVAPNEELVLSGALELASPGRRTSRIWIQFEDDRVETINVAGSCYTKTQVSAWPRCFQGAPAGEAMFAVVMRPKGSEVRILLTPFAGSSSQATGRFDILESVRLGEARSSGEDLELWWYRGVRRLQAPGGDFPSLRVPVVSGGQPWH